MTAPSTAGEKQPRIRIRETCERCSRQVRRHSRQGYTWRCPFCGFVNIGPGYRAQDRTPPEGTRRRVARRERSSEEEAAAAAAEQGQAGSGSPRPAPAPVRRKRTAATSPATAATQGSGDALSGSTPEATALPPRRGFWDRFVYGDGAEEEG